MASEHASFSDANKVLPLVDISGNYIFIKPVKRIHEGHDVPAFLTSHAYTDIGLFITQLNTAMCPRISEVDGKTTTQTWELGSLDVKISAPVQKLQKLLASIDAIIQEAPPDTGPRRFGNVSFREWYKLLEARASTLLDQALSSSILDVSGGSVSPKEELLAYLLGSFGSSQRLDYGTGHELSFLAFLGGIWKLNGFHEEELPDDDVSRSIVLGLIEPYLNVVRHLILTYTLEPAGSHGVWGLDDHFFLSYIFGSAQFCPAIKRGDSMPIEGSLLDAPNPGDVTKKTVVEHERKTNMYFAAVGFINDVKTGPFWEHSPILFDISGIRKGWGKINKGMIKMYNAEVLSKFPVVQHFPFGSLFCFDQDPNAVPVAASIHTDSQPSGHSISVSGNIEGAPPSRPLQAQEGTRAPWASQSSMPSTAAPRVQSSRVAPQSIMPPSAAPWAKPSASSQPTGMPPTRAPWATAGASSTVLPERHLHSQE